MDKDLLNRTDHQGAKGPVFIGEDKLLVYERDRRTRYYPGYLDFPGGGKDKSETVYETFKIEVDEEFGLAISTSDIRFVKQYPSTRYPGKLAYFVVAVLPESVAKTLKFSHEGLNHQIMDVTDFLSSPKAIPFLKERTEFFLKTVGL